ncbi:hypothetical protein F4810DRAFT_272227 [Camillea tinctor]|nr:hypothetical protein F4810DRAFT_272227 [Camillea tinctor]
MAYNQQPTSDELAALFSRNMTFQPAPSPPQQQPTPEPVITYSISQHYHHSAHIALQDEADQPQETSAPPQRPSSEPLPAPPAEQLLRSHGVDPAALSAAQLQLYKTAEPAQQTRLAELWRICPPSPPYTTLSATSVEQEELFAQLRYEQQAQRQAQSDGFGDETMMSLDGTPLTPVQTTEGRWAVAVPSSPYYGEPYMTTGYEELARREYEEAARRQFEEARAPPKDVYSHFGAAVGGPNMNTNTYRAATDPVYSGRGAWAQQEAMENQYGAYQMGGMEF